MNDDIRQAAFVATLGTEPQVVTITLDLLIERNANLRFDEVVVIHTDPLQKPIGDALRRLREAFASDCYRGRVSGVTFVEITHNGQPLQDVVAGDHASSVFACIYRQLAQQKRLNRLLYVNVSGGRKSMTAFGMASAQILFDASDRLWLLWSADPSAGKATLHLAPGERAGLVEIPVLRWSNVPPALLGLAVLDDPVRAIARQTDVIGNERFARCHQFLHDQLTDAERNVCVALVRFAHLSSKELAAVLGIKPRTLENTCTVIYGKLQSFYGARYADRNVLIAEFTTYLEQFPIES